MEHEQLALSEELLVAMHDAVRHALAGGCAYVAPAHLLLALLDEPVLGVALRDVLERGRLLADAKRKREPGIHELPERAVPAGERVTFRRYDSLAFRSPDGRSVMWLDGDARRIFFGGAKLVTAGAYKPKHLALGYLAESANDPALHDLLGRDPHAVTTAVYAL
jgi:hypothetical protein